MKSYFDAEKCADCIQALMHARQILNRALTAISSIAERIAARIDFASLFRYRQNRAHRTPSPRMMLMMVGRGETFKTMPSGLSQSFRNHLMLASSKEVCDAIIECRN